MTVKILVMLFVLCFMNMSSARQFRLITPIVSPQETTAQLPAGAKPVKDIQPLSRQEAEPLVRKVIEQWNTSGMASTLSERFYDKSRLMDVMDTGVPRDARLRIQGIRGIQTLQQYIQPSTDGSRDSIVSIVSATVQTQLEYNSNTGFKRLQGTNEFILKVTTAAPP